MKKIYVTLLVLLLFGTTNALAKKGNKPRGDWAKGVVQYQIIIDRFHNGDPNNDPTHDDMKNGWLGMMGAEADYDPEWWEVHPWTSDWYEMQPYEAANELSVEANLMRRRYGGDIQGVIDKLPYLKKLGVGVIWFCPIFESPGYMKYDQKLYHHIDANYGPDPASDRQLMANEDPYDPSTWVWTKADKLVLKLIKKAHRLGIGVIFDGVFNHMSFTSPAFQDVLAKKIQPKDSPYYDWFDILSADDPETSEDEFDYNQWKSIIASEPELPLLKEDDNGYVSQSLKDYIFAITERWMRPKGKVEDGIDGWRLDVASQVAIPFWREWIAHCKSIFPDVLLIAEVYEFYLRDDERLDLIPPEWQSPWLQEGLFNSLMNYNVFKSCVDYFITDMTSTSEFDAELEDIRLAHSPADPGLMQNHLGTHDTSRLASGIVNRSSLKGMTYVEKGLIMYAPWNPSLNTRKPSTEDNEIKKIMALFIMTYIGSPHIYYGDEVGMWGALYQGAHKPMLWCDLTYDDEVQTYWQVPYYPDTVEVDHDMLAFYRTLTRIRNNYEVVRLGDFETLLTDDVNKIYAFKRSFKKCEAVVILNNDEDSHQVDLELKKGKWRDVLNNEKFKVNKNENLLVEVDTRWGRILLGNHCYCQDDD